MKSVNELLKKIEQYFIGTLLLLVAVILFISVVLRLFDTSIMWAEEFARYAIVWITFVGASVCIYKGAHIGIDIFLQMLNNKGKKALLVFTIIFSIVFALLFTYSSFKITMNVHETKQYSSTMGIPMSVAYAAMPVGGILMVLRFIEELVKLVKEEGDK